MLNTEEFSKFDATVDLIVFTGDFVRDSATFSYLEQNIFPRYETDPAGNCSVDGELRHLLLVVPIGVDIGTKEYFNTKMRIAGGYQNHRISIFMHEVTDPKYNDLVALTVVAQEEVWMHGGAIPWIKHDVEALWDKGELKFNGLYDPKDSRGYHPDMNITNSNVRTMVNSIDSIINDHKADSTGANHTDTINRLTQLKGKLSLTTRAHIQIGGAAYDNVTLRDIVEDVVKAVRSTLIHGCVYGGGITLLETLLSVKAYYSDVAEDHVMSSYLQYLCDAFIYGTTGLINAVHNHIVIESAEGVHDYIRKYSGQSYNVVKRTSSEFGNGQPIIQAAEVDPEILKRFGEVAIRFVNMSKIITPGAVFLGDKKKKYLEAEKGEAEKERR